MAEELVLDDPVVKPEEVTNRYKIVGLNMATNSPVIAPETEPGIVRVTLEDNLKKILIQEYYGEAATDFIKFVNTGNFTVKSLNRRILEKMSNEGILPGTVVGEPEPPSDPEL